MNEEVSAVFVTYPDERTAHTICRSLIEQRLASCSNIFAIGSIYRWKDGIEEASEFASILKIRSVDFQNVVETIKRLHPYEVPCIVRYTISEGSADYMDWIVDSTARPTERRARK